MISDTVKMVIVKPDPPLQASACPASVSDTVHYFSPVQDSDLDNSSLETNNKTNFECRPKGNLSTKTLNTSYLT